MFNPSNSRKTLSNSRKIRAWLTHNHKTVNSSNSKCWHNKDSSRIWKDKDNNNLPCSNNNRRQCSFSSNRNLRRNNKKPSWLNRERLQCRKRLLCKLRSLRSKLPTMREWPSHSESRVKRQNTLSRPTFSTEKKFHHQSKIIITVKLRLCKLIAPRAPPMEALKTIL